MKYRREIDGLRAVAVVPVILFHAGFSLFGGGYVGVDVFFVISGYLITSIILGDLERGDFSIMRFYERRARRILPALFVVLLACLPFAYMWMLPTQLQDFAQSLIAVVFFASNILFWREDGYFAADAELKPLLHTWSLAVEEQFYLLFPIFLLLMWRYRRQGVFWIVVALAVLSLLLAEWGWRKQPSANFYLAPSRAWELLAGSICAFLLVGKTQRSSNVLSAVGLALIVFAVFAYDSHTPFPSFYALVPVVGTVLIILFAAERTWVARLLSMPAFVGIGLISYSAYLWHQPLFAFARLRSLAEPSHMLMAALAVASLLLAWATWYWVEQAFRTRANPVLVARRDVFVASGVAGAVFAVVGVSGQLGDGFKWRFQDPVDVVGDYGQSDFLRTLDTNFVDCEPAAVAQMAPEWEGYLRCKQTRPGFSDVVLLGDSHAEHLFIGLAGQMQQHNVAFFIQDGLPFLSSREFSSIFDELTAPGRGRVVLLSIHYERFPDAIDGQRLFSDDLVSTVERLQASGNEVILLEDIPKFYTDPEDCMLTGRLHRCTVSYDSFVFETSGFNEMLREAARRTNVPVLGFSELICRSGLCSMFSGNTLLYRDRDHLNLIGSETVGKHLASLLADAMGTKKLASPTAAARRIE